MRGIPVARIYAAFDEAEVESVADVFGKVYS